MSGRNDLPEERGPGAPTPTEQGVDQVEETWADYEKAMLRADDEEYQQWRRSRDPIGLRPWMEEAERPKNVEAEAALLGAVMIDNRMLDDLGGRLNHEDFFEPVHGRIWQQMLRLRGEGSTATPVTLRPLFDKDPALEAVGGAAYLAQLTGSGAAIIGARDFAAQVMDLAMLRRIQDAALDGLRAAADTTTEIAPVKIANDVATRILAVTERTEAPKIRTASAMIERAIERSVEIRSGVNIGATTETVEDINEVIGALGGGSMTAIGGRPSMGKSILLQSALWGYAKRGHHVLGLSLEMSDDDLSMRLAADLAFAMGEPVPYSHIRRGRMSVTEERVLEAVRDKVTDLPLRMTSPDRSSIEEIEAIASRHAGMLERQGHHLEVIGVDYIQIVGTKKRLQGREKIDYISERLLALGKRLGCHMLVLSQLSRGVEARPDKRPQMSDLKESGRIEEDSENVILLYRPEFYLASTEPEDKFSKEYETWHEEYQTVRDRVDFIMPKVRHGTPATRRGRFYGAYQAIRGSNFREAVLGEGAMI